MHKEKSSNCDSDKQSWNWSRHEMNCGREVPLLDDPKLYFCILPPQHLGVCVPDKPISLYFLLCRSCGNPFVAECQVCKALDEQLNEQMRADIQFHDDEDVVFF